MISADFIMIEVKIGNLRFSIKASKRRMGTMEAKVTQDHDQIMILVGLSGTVQFPKIPERREGGVDKRKERRRTERRRREGWRELLPVSRSTHCGQQISFCNTFTQLIMIRNYNIMITADFIMIARPGNFPYVLTNPSLELLYCDNGGLQL